MASRITCFDRFWHLCSTSIKLLCRRLDTRSSIRVLHISSLFAIDGYVSEERIKLNASQHETQKKSRIHKCSIRVFRPFRLVALQALPPMMAKPMGRAVLAARRQMFHPPPAPAVIPNSLGPLLQLPGCDAKTEPKERDSRRTLKLSFHVCGSASPERNSEDVISSIFNRRFCGRSWMGMSLTVHGNCAVPTARCLGHDQLDPHPVRRGCNATIEVTVQPVCGTRA
ncbi:hypothetical protein C8R47DRAFT_1159336 [Mycena vitilis]|nr:hypothetical protein C8R47DRAFT_1159336 [Mycena vitilis]